MVGLPGGRGSGRRTVRAAIASGMVGVLMASAVIAPQTAEAITNPVSGIDGTYQFNANGWTGTLTIIDAANETPGIVMTYDESGTTEDLTGDWSAVDGELTFLRPLSNGVEQLYDLYLGNHVAGSPVFGGSFVESDIPGYRFGVFADDYVPRTGPRTHVQMPGAANKTVAGRSNAITAATAPNSPGPQLSPAYTDNLDWPDLLGAYDFNGNGWTGTMGISQDDCASFEGVRVDYDAIGTWEQLGALWDNYDNALTLVRTLSDGITQTYTLFIGQHVSPAVAAEGYHPASVMFGGYFTESDTGGKRYAAFATYAPPGLGC
jgi:hypothetical protein